MATPWDLPVLWLLEEGRGVVLVAACAEGPVLLEVVVEGLAFVLDEAAAELVLV